MNEVSKQVYVRYSRNGTVSLVSFLFSIEFVMARGFGPYKPTKLPPSSLISRFVLLFHDNRLVLNIYIIIFFFFFGLF